MTDPPLATPLIMMQVAVEMPCLTSNKVEIDLEALEHNFRVLEALLSGSGARMLAVVKSDAYGHGIVEVSKALEALGAWGFGISEIEEGHILRDAGISSPILLMSGLCPGTEDEVIKLDLITGIPDKALLNALERAAAKAGRRARVHLKVDTGMGRLGLSGSEFQEVLNERSAWPHLEFQGIFSHFSAADTPEDPLNQEQIDRFTRMLRMAEHGGWIPDAVHMANSAGLIHFPQARFNLARPGIALYGAYPGDASRHKVNLRPVMSFKSKVISLKDVPEGFTVSYGHTFVTARASRIGVVPVGYDDGYPRRLSNRGRVLVRGRSCPVVGRICMKALMVDLTGVDGASTGDDVVLLGSQHGATITVEEVAQWADTISYELLCLLGTRNQRRYLKGD